MKTLLLLRHAKSSWSQPQLEDRDRPLNTRGERSARVMAQRLAENGPRPDAAVTSPAKRARQTLAYFLEQLALPESHTFVEESLYGATAETWLGLIPRLNDDWHTVIMVGHNPTITNLAHRIGRKDIANVPTCGILECQSDCWDDWRPEPDCRIVNFDYPKRVVE